jgi:hypothetical protein
MQLVLVLLPLLVMFFLLGPYLLLHQFSLSLISEFVFLGFMQVFHNFHLLLFYLQFSRLVAVFLLSKTMIWTLLRKISSTLNDDYGVLDSGDDDLYLMTVILSSLLGLPALKTCFLFSPHTWALPGLSPPIVKACTSMCNLYVSYRCSSISLWGFFLTVKFCLKQAVRPFSPRRFGCDIG